MTSWLTRQRKQALLDLGDEAGLQLEDDMRKDEIVEALDTHLQQNATELQRNSTFNTYYSIRQTPYKMARRSAAGDSDEAGMKSVVRGRGRRATQVKSEPRDEPEELSSQSPQLPSTNSPTFPAAHTPTTSIIQRRRSSLPPSPSFVVDEVEQASTRFYAGVADLYTLSGIPEGIERVRENCSTLVAVHLSFLLIEGYSLGTEILPWKYAFDVPASRFTSSVAVSIPDLFVLLSSSFWAPTLLWSMTSLFIPLSFAYFYNLTVHNVKRNNAKIKVVRYQYDPFIYNVVKALCTSLIYGAEIFNGFLGSRTVTTVALSQYGGFQGIMSACYICGLVAMWEAANS